MRKTVGAHALELLQKSPDTCDSIELEREAHKEYESNVIEAVDRGKKLYNNSFFVVVLTKKEPLMENVLRHYFFPRRTCPTPDYDQTVYRYNHAEERIEFVWTIPDRGTSFHLIENKQVVVPEEHALLHYVLLFENGTLYKVCKKLNNERDDSNELEEG